MPAFAYKSIKQATQPFQQPIVITRDITLPSDFQIADHLLCSDCEGRFNSRETYVSGLIDRRSGFRFLEYARLGKIIARTELGTVYSLNHVQALKIADVAYFAWSVAWRAATHRWRGLDGKMLTSPGLGPYEEGIRRYLLGEAPIPERYALLIELHANQPGTALSTPVKKRIEGQLAICFEIPGIQFVMFVGKMLPESIMSMSILHDEQPVVVLDGPIRIKNEAALGLIKGSRLSTKLAQKMMVR